AALAELLAQVVVAPANPAAPDGSKLISLKNPSSAIHPSIQAQPRTPVTPHTTARGKSFDSERASAQAAALLSAAGGGTPLTGGGPLSTTGVKLVKNSLGMMFARITGGTFRMGSPDDEPGRREHEGPVHEGRSP